MGFKFIHEQCRYGSLKAKILCTGDLGLVSTTQECGDKTPETGTFDLFGHSPESPPRKVTDHTRSSALDLGLGINCIDSDICFQSGSSRKTTLVLHKMFIKRNQWLVTFMRGKKCIRSSVGNHLEVFLLISKQSCNSLYCI